MICITYCLSLSTLVVLCIIVYYYIEFIEMLLLLLAISGAERATYRVNSFTVAD